MFGGITFLLRGNALAKVYEERLMVRVGPEGMDEALARPGTRQLVFPARSGSAGRPSQRRGSTTGSWTTG
ncbi:TfoX/Sxy family protein [Streptosporangium nondiastaticum]|uniref:TfoX/Sxy family protein n=1 Tax=Streptosporangium nondiastaticum TaxID=35764 RepID=UPI001CB988E1